MEKLKNIPTLRFPEFDGEWESKKLGEVAMFLDGRRKPIKSSDRLKIKGEYPYYGASGIIDYINDYIFDEEIILLGEDGENIISRNLPLAFKVVGKCWINNHAHVLKPKQNYQIDFLTQLLENVSYVQYNTGTAQPKLNQEICRGIPLTFPCYVEQTKIASFLTSVDDKLQALKQKKTLLEQYKKGVMQKIFSQELRFKDDNGNDYPDWEEKKLGDTLNITVDNRGKTPPTLEHGIPLLEVNSIGNKNIKYNAVSKFVSELTFETWFRKHLKKGDVLFSTVGNTALCSYYDGNIKACIAQNIVGLRFNTDIGLFMYYLLIEDRNNNKFKQIEMGAVQPSVKVSQMIDLYFEIPSTPEQTKIANFLSTIDKKINHCQAQIEKTEVWKKGLLQQMFV